MYRKRLSRRLNFHARTAIARATPLKRFHRHGFPHRAARREAAKRRRLPPVRRNVPSFGRMTSLVRASFSHRFAMRLKRFTGRRFSSRSDRAIMISPQRRSFASRKRRPSRSAFSFSIREPCSEAISGFVAIPHVAFAHAGYDFIQTSQRIIHIKLDRMRGHLEAFDFGHLQLDVAVDEIVVEHAAVL